MVDKHQGTTEPGLNQLGAQVYIDLGGHPNRSRCEDLMQIIATCPCGQQYNADSASVGTQLQCSTCGQVFIMSATAYPSQTTPMGNGFPLDNRYGQPSPPDPLQPLSPAASNPSPPEPANTSGLQPAVQSGQRVSSPRAKRNLKPLWISLGAGLAALVIVLLCFLFLGRSKPSNGMELTYLPSNLSQFYFIDLEKIQESKTGMSFLERDFFAQQHLGSLESITQLPLKEIRSVTVGYTEPDIDSNFQRNGPMSIPNISFASFFRFCGVIRTKQEYDQQKILDAAPVASKQEHAGHEYYLVEPVRGASSETTRGIAFPDSKTILFGTETELKNALTGSKAPNDDLFSNVKPGDHLVSITKGGEFGQFGLKKSGVSVSFGDEIEGSMWSEFTSSHEASQIGSANVTFESMANELQSFVPARHSAQFQKFLKQDKLFGLKGVEVNGNVVSTTFTGNGNQLAARGALAQVLVGMLHRFSRFNSFADPMKTSFTNRGNLNRPAKKEVARNKKVVQPDPRKQKIASKDFNRLPRYRPGAGKKIDLLALFYPSKDSVSGKWLFENEKLVCKSGNFRPRIQFPYKPPREYDLKIVFRQPKPSGNISLLIPNRGSSFSWILGGNQIHQFSVNPIKKNPSAVRIDSLIKPNRSHALILQRRSNAVTAVFDGRIISEFNGAFGDLKEDRRTELKNKDLLGFCCEAETSISEIELTEVSGSGSFVE